MKAPASAGARAGRARLRSIVASSGSSEAGNPTPLTLGALAYLILFIPFVWFGRRIEKRFAWKR